MDKRSKLKSANKHLCFLFNGLFLHFLLHLNITIVFFHPLLRFLLDVKYYWSCKSFKGGSGFNAPPSTRLHQIKVIKQKQNSLHLQQKETHLHQNIHIRSLNIKNLHFIYLYICIWPKTAFQLKTKTHQQLRINICIFFFSVFNWLYIIKIRQYFR